MSERRDRARTAPHAASSVTDNCRSSAAYGLGGGSAGNGRDLPARSSGAAGLDRSPLGRHRATGAAPSPLPRAPGAAVSRSAAGPAGDCAAPPASVRGTGPLRRAAARWRLRIDRRRPRRA